MTKTQSRFCVEMAKARRLSGALRGLLASRVRQARRDTIYKMSKKKGCGIVRCFVCGEPVSYSEATLEHIIPKSKGGTDDMGNLSISHARCNNARGAEDPE